MAPEHVATARAFLRIEKFGAADLLVTLWSQLRENQLAMPARTFQAWQLAVQGSEFLTPSHGQIRDANQRRDHSVPRSSIHFLRCLEL